MGNGVVLTRRAYEGDAARGHHLEAHQTEGLVPGIGQDAVGGTIEQGYGLVGEEGTDVVDVRLRQLFTGIHHIFGQTGQWDVLDHQPAVPGILQDLLGVGLDPAAHRKADVRTVRLETCHSVYRHVPALVRAPPAYLKEQGVRGECLPQPTDSL